MQFIDESVPFENGPWRTAALTTPKMTLHIMYMQHSAEVICFGVEALLLEPDASRQLIKAVEAHASVGSFYGDHGIRPCRVLRFDALGHVSGQHRRFAKGWANDIDSRVIHVFPCYQCELSESWDSSKFSSTLQGFNVFNLSREPSPYVEIKMSGGLSLLSLSEWSATPLSSVLTYARILAKEHEGTLQVRNIWGDELLFNQSNGWHGCEKVITTHVQQHKGT